MVRSLVAAIRRRSFAERYLGTAAVVWLLYGSLSAALLHTGLPTWVAGGSAYSVALLVHFSMHRFLVFRRDELDYHHDITTQVWRYLTTAALQYSFTLAGTAVLMAQTDLHRAEAYVGCAALAAGLNFLALKFLVFPHSGQEPADGPPEPELPVPVAREPVPAGRED